MNCAGALAKRAGAAPRAPMFDDAVIGELPYKGVGEDEQRI